MYERGVATIGDWQKGVNESPLFGHSSIVGCDIFDTPGVLKIASATTLESTPTGLLLARVIGTDGSTYSLYDDGKFYKGTTLLATVSNPNDLIVYKNYILFTHGAVSSFVGAYGPLTSPGLFTTAFALSAGADVYFKKMLIGSNGNLYVGNGSYVARLTNFTTGTAFVAPTATTTLTALALPSGVSCVTLENIGKYLAVGTQLGLNFSERANYNHAHIYLWDFTSASYQLPIQIRERGMNAMVSTGNTIYFSAGNKGNIYASDTTEYKRIKKIPFSTRKQYASTYVYPNAMAFSGTNTLLIGTSGTDAQSIYNHGIWELDQNDTPTKNNAGYAIALKHIPSSGVTGKTDILKIGCIASSSAEQVTFGWQSGSTYGVDILAITPYKNYFAYAESPLITVGTSMNQKTFKVAEYRLFEPLVTGQQIRISYRKKASGVYTVMGTFSTTNTDADLVSHNFPAGIADADVVQFKVELDAGTSPVFPNNISFINLTVY